MGEKTSFCHPDDRGLLDDAAIGEGSQTKQKKRADTRKERREDTKGEKERGEG